MNNIRYGPCGGIYLIVTTTAQTGGIIFALECTENLAAVLLCIFTGLKRNTSS